MRVNAVFVLTLALLLSACGSGSSGNPNELAAAACDAAARERLEGKSYQLDLAALAASMKDATEGAHLLSAPVVIEPGLSTEFKQTLECTVRFSEGKAEPDVIGFLFIW